MSRRFALMGIIVAALALGGCNTDSGKQATLTLLARCSSRAVAVIFAIRFGILAAANVIWSRT